MFGTSESVTLSVFPVVTFLDHGEYVMAQVGGQPQPNTLDATIPVPATGAVYPYLVATLSPTNEANTEYSASSVDFKIGDCAYKIGDIVRETLPRTRLVLLYGLPDNPEDACALTTLDGLVIRFGGYDHELKVGNLAGIYHYWYPLAGFATEWAGMEILVGDPDFEMPAEGRLAAVQDTAGVGLYWNGLGNTHFDRWEYRSRTGESGAWSEWNLLASELTGDQLSKTVPLTSNERPDTFQVQAMVELTELGMQEGRAAVQVFREALVYDAVTVQADLAPAFTENSTIAIEATTGTTITPVTLPIASKGNDPTTYALTGAPKWLKLSENSSGEPQLSGTPSEAHNGLDVSVSITDIDQDTATKSFAVLVNPLPITNLDVEKAGTDVMVSWDNDDEGVMGWEIQQKANDDDWPLSWTAITPTTPVQSEPPSEDTRDHQHLVKGLDGSHSYLFRLRSVTRMNSAKPTLYGTVATTSPAVTPNAPPVISPSELTVTVNEDITSGTVIATFTVSDADAGDDEPSWTLVENITVEGGLSKQEPSDEFEVAAGAVTLKTGKTLDYESQDTYELTVRVTDIHGSSSTATLTVNVADRDEPPGLVTLVVESDGARHDKMALSWTAPDMSGKPAITGYDIRYCKGLACDTLVTPMWVDVMHVGLGTETVVTGLESLTDYRFQARAKNDEGSGAWSRVVGGQTAPDPLVFDSDLRPSMRFLLDEKVRSTTVLPSATGGIGALTYALTPALPSGVSFDPATRQITGTPTVPKAAADYTYTVTDSSTPTARQTSQTVSIEVVPAAPTGLFILPQGKKPASASTRFCWDLVSDDDLTGWQVRRFAHTISEASPAPNPNGIKWDHAIDPIKWKDPVSTKENPECHFDTDISRDNAYIYQVRATFSEGGGTYGGQAAQSQAVTAWDLVDVGDAQVAEFRLSSNPIDERTGTTWLTVTLAKEVEYETKFEFDFITTDLAPYGFGLTPIEVTINKGETAGKAPINVIAFNDDKYSGDRHVQLEWEVEEKRPNENDVLEWQEVTTVDANKNPDTLWVWILEDEPQPITPTPTPAP